MRVLKLLLLVILVLLAGLFTYVLIQPALWYAQTKHKSIRVLARAKTTNELTEAVAYLGVFLPLTNGAWIAIRYRDSHSGGISSLAVARDSGGGWFESGRHFCGSLSAHASHRKNLEALRWLREQDPTFTNQVSVADDDNGPFPSFRELEAIESAPDLESARRALLKIGFTQFKR